MLQKPVGSLQLCKGIREGFREEGIPSENMKDKQEELRRSGKERRAKGQEQKMREQRP